MNAVLDASIKPKLATPFPKHIDEIKDKKTGIVIPKREKANLKWRTDLLKRAEDDIGLQEDLLAACKQSYNFFINAFCWTYHQQEFDVKTGKPIPVENAHVPFITWDIQDEFFDELYKSAIERYDLGVKKSRDMGASWCCIAMIHYFWLFFDNKQVLELSRVEDYVDKAGNMKALFQKHDYINAWLPRWMLPPYIFPGKKHRTKMHMYNELNGSCIDGESTTEHAASGDRRFLILLDEFAKVNNGQAIRSATADVSSCRWVNSTPAGPGTEYSRWTNSGQIKVFVLPFWEHPEKGAGRECIQDPVTKEWDITSPWLKAEEERRSQREVAREIKMRDIESGDLFFTPVSDIDKHIAIFGRNPICRMTIKFNSSVANDAISDMVMRRDIRKLYYRKTYDGPLRIWCKLFSNRPDQTKHYAIGCDISKGQGASNSVMSIKCVETGVKIAEWADANTPPYEMARLAIALALWVGGKRLPFLKWEKNGPGWDFGRLVVKKFNYPYFYKTVVEGKTTEKTTTKYGWHASRENKELLLSAYNRVMAHGGYLNPSVPALEEMKQYIYYKDGSIGPASLVEENASAKKTHGDRVIADALTIDENRLPKLKHAAPVASPRSVAYRYQQLMKRKQQLRKKTGQPYNFGA